MVYDPDARFDVTTVDVPYLELDGVPYLATVYRPSGSGPFPGLVDVHGGAWTVGHRGSDQHMNRALASSGVVVVALDFRVAPSHPYPAQIQDVNLGVRWFKAHAEEHGVDPASIGAIGSSSGGNTAMLCAMRPHDPRYAAHTLAGGSSHHARLRYVIAAWPILDPYARYFFAQDTGRQDLITRTEGYFLNEEAMQEGNPQMILDRGESVELPPTLLIQGTADTNLSMAMSERFVASYRRSGGDADLEKFPDMPHGFANEPGRETDRALEIMRRFIARKVAVPV